jgi:hypothetical protein
MSGRLQALNGRGPASVIPESSLVETAIVVSTPVTVDDEVFVTLDAFDTQRTIGPVLGWRTRPDLAWPQRGDRALVVQAPQGDYWFVDWEPATPGLQWETITDRLHPDWIAVETPEVAITGGFVHLRGVIELAGATGTGSMIIPHATALPDRYLPTADRYCSFNVDTYNASATLSGWVGQLILYTDGELTLANAKIVRGDLLGSTLNVGFIAGQTLVLDGLTFSI